MNVTMQVFAFFICLLLGLSQAISVQEKNITDGVKFFEAQGFDEAEKYFTVLIKQQANHAQGLYYLGRVEFEKRAFDKAVERFEKCVDLVPDNSEYLSWLGWTYLKQVDDASIFSKGSLAKKARIALEKSVKLDPTNISGLAHLGEFYLGAPGFAGGSVEKARTLAKKLVDLDEIAGRLILLRIMQKEDESKVMAEYRLLAEKIGDNGKYAEFYNRYGYFLLEQEMHDEAVLQFEKQVQMRSADANSYDSLGDGYHAKGRLQDARKAYQNALAIDSGFTTSEKSLAKVEKALKKAVRK